VSGLSPWLRRRLVSEPEVIAQALGAHGFSRAGKFIEEVAWRGYFKGWLEHRPSVWTDYVAAMPELRATHDSTAAEEGRTGIPAFDAWARELVTTGYLHNHTRMWFASIWTFTLQLPWQLGADFFLRNLIDGDPASNTCSWRWLAGLHTAGKVYAARAPNIVTFTEGRFAGTTGLAVNPTPVEGGNPPAGVLREPWWPDPAIPSVRLITEEDCHVESLAPIDTVATATVALTARRSDRPVAEAVASWDAGALADAAVRASGATAFGDPGPEAFADWVAGTGARQVVTAYIPTGWVRDWAEGIEPALARRGIRLAEQRRPYDAAIWPHARGGFFGLKKKLPGILADLGL
jgi:deoxyribodipyrimidine photo-lyase